jgi:CHASE1-domain containing sensor protein
MEVTPMNLLMIIGLVLLGASLGVFLVAGIQAIARRSRQ